MTKFRCKDLAAAAIVLAIVCTLSRPSEAKEVALAAYLATQCFNGDQMKADQQVADEAWALNDDDRFDAAQHAARQYYRCAHVTVSAYVHDWSRFLYAYWLLYSYDTKAKFLQHAELSYDVFEELATGSKFADVRGSAQTQRLATAKRMEFNKESLNL